MERSTINTTSLGADRHLVVNDSIVFGGKENCSIKELNISHPLEAALLQHEKKHEEINLNMLRKMQGLHAPLRLQMEKQAIKDVGHLPCLHRHNALHDALTGNDMALNFEDFLNAPIDSEFAGNPHVVIERHQGIF